MPVPSQSESSGSVVRAALLIASRVNGDPSAKPKAKPLFDSRAALKAQMRARQDADDALIIAAGLLDAAAAQTDRSLEAFSRKAIGELEGDDAPGDEDPQYLRIMKDATARSLLPAGRADRTTEIKALAVRIKDKRTPANVRKAGDGLLAAIAGELAAVEAHKEADGELGTAGKAEAKAKEHTIITVRELAGTLNALFAKEPSRARRLLGQQVPRKGKGKKKPAPAPASAPPVAAG